jgi:hypothetical protein
MTIEDLIGPVEVVSITTALADSQEVKALCKGGTPLPADDVLWRLWRDFLAKRAGYQYALVRIVK